MPAFTGKIRLSDIKNVFLQDAIQDCGSERLRDGAADITGTCCRLRGRENTGTAATEYSGVSERTAE